jgi:hypothetical protein
MRLKSTVPRRVSCSFVRSWVGNGCCQESTSRDGYGVTIRGFSSSFYRKQRAEKVSGQRRKQTASATFACHLHFSDNSHKIPSSNTDQGTVVYSASLFMSMGWECVSELRPTTGLFFIPQMVCEYGELRWNNTDRENTKNSEKDLSQCHFVLHKSHTDWSGRELGPPRWESAD